MRWRFVALVVIATLGGPGCSREQWGFPRVPLRMPSPDGRFIAFVRNHPNIDPPAQTLWLGVAPNLARRVAQLPPDTLWCDRIVWSANNRHVAFVIADAIVQVYDAHTQARVFSGFVGRRSWDTPPRFVLRDVSLSSDGGAFTFRECERTWRPVEPGRQNARGTRVESSIANCSDATQTVAFSGVVPAHLW